MVETNWEYTPVQILKEAEILKGSVEILNERTQELMKRLGIGGGRQSLSLVNSWSFLSWLWITKRFLCFYRVL